MAVLVNIGVWLTEQLVQIDFEILSLSYIISELFLLGVHMVMKEQQRLTALLHQLEAAKSPEVHSDAIPEVPAQAFPPERVELFLAGLSRLTPTEKEIYKAYTARATTKEILAKLNITENTLKYHNRNLYGKLGVGSRKELLELFKYITTLQTKL
ncbi:MAG: hypothetical protein J6Q54_04900 [Oscillospiraceae bacterium]|nr:hypothetical protein [Oscillospiraceae bacterium]